MGEIISASNLLDNRFAELDRTSRLRRSDSDKLTLAQWSNHTAGWVKHSVDNAGDQRVTVISALARLGFPLSKTDTIIDQSSLSQHIETQFYPKFFSQGINSINVFAKTLVRTTPDKVIFQREYPFLEELIGGSLGSQEAARAIKEVVEKELEKKNKSEGRLRDGGPGLTVEVSPDTYQMWMPSTTRYSTISVYFRRHRPFTTEDDPKKENFPLLVRHSVPWTAVPGYLTPDAWARSLGTGGGMYLYKPPFSSTINKEVEKSIAEANELLGRYRRY